MADPISALIDELDEHADRFAVYHCAQDTELHGPSVWDQRSAEQRERADAIRALLARLDAETARRESAEKALRPFTLDRTGMSLSELEHHYQAARAHFSTQSKGR